MQAGNEPMATYVSGAYRRDAIPEQAPLKDISGFAKSLEAGDFMISTCGHSMQRPIRSV